MAHIKACSKETAYEEKLIKEESESAIWEDGIDMSEVRGIRTHDAGIGIIYWRTDNLKLQQIMEEFLSQTLPTLL